MQPESKILQSIRVAASKAGARLFRNNVAQGWVGKSTQYQVSARVHVEPGDVVIRNGRRLHSGLCVGSSDLIGWSPVEITEDMVGRTLPVFTAVEVKTRTGRATKEQKQFVEYIRSVGGLAGIARSDEDAVDVVRAYSVRRQSS